MGDECVRQKKLRRRGGGHPLPLGVVPLSNAGFNLFMFTVCASEFGSGLDMWE